MQSDPLEEMNKREAALKKDKDFMEWKLAGIISDRMININDKNKCYDMFWHLKIGGQRMY